MMMTSQNPFKPTRWEHHSDGHPLIWFTPLAAQLSDDKSAYLTGSRGSGKTTLLRSICWEDVVSNPSLKMQRLFSDFNHIGIYVRFPDHISASMGFMRWRELFPSAPDPNHQYLSYFSLVIELICAEKAIIATHELRLQKFIEYEASQESRIVAEICDEYGKLESFAERIPRTFIELGRLLRNIIRRLNEASGRGTMSDLVPYLPAREPHELLSFIIDKLSGAVRRPNASGRTSLGYKFCLDDCEVLNTLQRRTANTLVRKAKFPVSWVISSVGDGMKSSDTFIPQQPLTEADRVVISLDERGRFDFRQLCEAVSSLRIYYSFGETSRPSINRENIDTFFSLDQRLGSSSVNLMFQQIIKKSTSPICSLLLHAAEQLRRAMAEVHGRTPEKYLAENEQLPFYEAYVLLHWTGREDGFRTSISDANLYEMLAAAPRLKAANFQAWLRRKSVGALLHFSGRLGLRRLPLSGSNVILSLADGSIRDFLEIMAEIYDRYISSPASQKNSEKAREQFAFGRTKIASRHQTDGIYAASESFYEGISAQTEATPNAAIRLIEALGRYTGTLQSGQGDPTVLGRAERGIFIIEFSPPGLIGDRPKEEDRRALLETLRQAEVAGYLRTVAVKQDSDQFQSQEDLTPRLLAYRLHRRLAPRFRFSYRGAYEALKIDADWLAELCKPRANLTIDAWLKGAPARLQLATAQLALPLPPDTYDE